jgi:hypothetical protein
MNLITAHRDWMNRQAEKAAQQRQRAALAAPAATMRVPLTTSQHILHLLITVLTLGLWAPVWILRAIAGNQVPARPRQAQDGTL